MAAEWSTDVEEGDWIAASVRGFGVDVGSIVPHGFEAYARILHPIQRGPHRRWSDLARANGRVAHPTMQLHRIATPVGEPPESPHVQDSLVAVGSLPRPECAALADCLARHTSTPERCWFAVWEGWGQIRGLAPDDVWTAGRLRLPQRAYLVLRGAVDDVGDACDRLGGGPAQSPNLWWPADRAWVVATEIDFGYTYVAGSAAAIADVLAASGLEARPARVDDGVDATSDGLNL